MKTWNICKAKFQRTMWFKFNFQGPREYSNQGKQLQKAEKDKPQH